MTKPSNLFGITPIVQLVSLGGSGGSIGGNDPGSGTVPPSGQIPTATGSNSWAWGSNVAIITSNSSNQLLGPFVNFASGSGIAFAAASNTLTISSTVSSGGGGGGGGVLTQAYVGYNTIGGSTENATTQRVYAKKITLASDCLLTSVEAYIDQGNGDNVVAAMGAGIFTDNAGTPQYLLQHTIQQESLSIVLDTTSAGGGNTNPRWFSWAIGRWVTAGDYWIAVMAHDTKIRLYKDGSGTDRYYTATGEWMADWGFYTPTTTTDRYSIRANTIR